MALRLALHRNQFGESRLCGADSDRGRVPPLRCGSR